MTLLWILNSWEKKKNNNYRTANTLTAISKLWFFKTHILLQITKFSSEFSSARKSVAFANHLTLSSFHLRQCSFCIMKLNSNAFLFCFSFPSDQLLTSCFLDIFALLFLLIIQKKKKVLSFLFAWPILTPTTFLC